jgi:serine/threonine protein kinase
MDASQWKLTKEALATAMELQGDVRRDFLATLSGDIRPDVERLLAADANARSFINVPVLVERGVVSDDPESDDAEGQLIDDYFLIRKIGSGGMGAVYLAVKSGEGFSQQVALKLIKRGMDTGAVLKRFLMERQILANLEHPNIARMLDGGSTAEGLPYFVMEYIDGEEIRDYCDQSKLGLNQRLELFRKICDAVANAHQKLVVHRDLKPSNILVTKDGEPKLLDFGIAKLTSPDWNTDTNEATITQFRIMTPEYASPEQLAGEATATSTDIYSLGVVLYELLTGERPHITRGKTPKEIAESMLSAEPPKPSTVRLERSLRGNEETDYSESNPTGPNSPKTRETPDIVQPAQLQGDLDNIILKAMRREPERRYQSVQEFSEDIRRYLDGLPVKATADSSLYRFGKFFKRHRTAVVGTAAAALLLIAATAVTGWQYSVAERERLRSERQFAETRKIANSLLFEIHDSISDLSGATPARKLLVARAVEYLDNLAKDAQNDMTLQDELAAGYEKIGDVQGNPLGPNLGEAEAAIESYAKALAIREMLAVESEKPTDHYSAAMLHSKLFRIKQVRNDLAEAEVHCRESIRILERLTSADPSNLLNQVTTARFYLELGDLLATKKDSDNDEILRNYGKSISISEAIEETEETNKKGPDGLSLNEKLFSVTQMAYRRLGQRFEMLKQPAEALANYQQALEASEKLAAAGSPRKASSEIVIAISLGNVGRLQAGAGNFDDAFAKVRKMVEICEKAAAEDPKNRLAVSQLSLAYASLGYVYRKQNVWQSALENLKRSAKIQEELQAKDAGDVYNAGNLGETLAAIGTVYENLAAAEPASKRDHFREAQKWHERSLKIWADLKNENKLPAYYSSKIDEQNQSVVRCEAALKG